jgi:DNA-directed RNA polymerase subunit RPC12/RpoP
MNHLQCPHCSIKLIWYFREVNSSCEPPQVWNRYICANCRHIETVVYEADHMNKTIKVHLKHDY